VSERPDAQQARPDLSRRNAASRSECAYVDDLAASFVLSALESSERRRVDRHRAECADCDALLQEMQATVNVLGVVAKQVAPPPRTKRALLDQIAQSPQVESRFRQPSVTTAAAPTVTIPSSRDAFAPVPSDWRAAGPTPAPIGTRTGMGRFIPNWSSIATPLATVPLVLALGIVGVWAMNTQSKLSARSAEIQTLSSQVSTLSDRVVTLNSTLADVDGFIEAADAKRYDMTPVDGAVSSDAVGQVIANPGTDEALLVLKSLGDRHSMYQVVLESEGGEFTEAGEIPVTATGDGKAVLKLSQPFSSYRSVHVKPLTDNQDSSTDSRTFSAPDALSGSIDPNLGSSGDTDVPDVGQSG